METTYAQKAEKTRLKLMAKGQAVTLLQKQVSGGEEWRPTFTLPHNLIFYVLSLDVKETKEASSDNTEVARKVMLSVHATAVPKDGDRMRIGDTTYTLRSVSPFAPGGVTIFYYADIVA